jgi:hypothetical protein
MNRLVRELRRLGHDVTVITGWVNCMPGTQVQRGLLAAVQSSRWHPRVSLEGRLACQQN